MPRVYAKHRTFDRNELAFFAIPRTWLGETGIVARFGDGSDVRDAIIHLDNKGGFGLLRLEQKDKTWVLTSKGRNWLSPHLLAKGKRWAPGGT